MCLGDVNNLLNRLLGLSVLHDARHDYFFFSKPEMDFHLLLFSLCFDTICTPCGPLRLPISTLNIQFSENGWRLRGKWGLWQFTSTAQVDKRELGANGGSCYK